MTRDESGGTTLTSEEIAAAKRAGRKQLAEDGCPEDRIPGAQNAGEKAKPRAVPESEKPGLIDSMKGM
ncbi:hypothetical protein [Methylobacterium sp. J-067]|uniref:hypothetical protein n=1 Tax=Methylobacterium sp. J-067 TaxID=2836648 RepID=UPI001FB8FF8A|nr:hypothetical protein [Methylobacterium sp. J-067]MCJ2023273.1 hypothetical protein [Methylobacterium sp. J-067]